MGASGKVPDDQSGSLGSSMSKKRLLEHNAKSFEQKSSAKKNRPIDVITLDGTPPINNYFRPLQYGFRPAIITLDSPIKAVKVPQTEDDDCAVMFEKKGINPIRRNLEGDDCTVIFEKKGINPIRRNRSIKQQTSILELTPNNTPVRRISSEPVTIISLKSNKLVRKLSFEENDSSFRSAGSSCRNNSCRFNTSSQSSTPSSDTARKLNDSRPDQRIGVEHFKNTMYKTTLQKTLSLSKGWEWCEYDVNMFMGSRYRHVAAAAESEDENWSLLPNENNCQHECFLTFFTTYTSTAERGLHSTEEESANLWQSILEFLEGCYSTNACPAVSILHAILIRGVLKNPNVNVRKAAFSFMQRFILYLYPPHSAASRDVYKKLFVRNPFATSSDLNAFDPTEMWDFFIELIEEAKQEHSVKKGKDSGPLLLLELVLLILQSDLMSWINCSLHSQKLESSLPIIARLFWSGDIGVINIRVESVTKAYLSIVFLSPFKNTSHCRGRSITMLSRLLKQIISMLAQFIDIYDRHKEQSILKQNLVDSFIVLLENFEKNNSYLSHSRLWMQLYLLKPDWFSAAIARALIKKTVMRILSGTVPSPLHESQYLLLGLRKSIEEMENIQDLIAKSISSQHFSNKGGLEAKQNFTIKKTFSESNKAPKAIKDDDGKETELVSFATPVKMNMDSLPSSERYPSTKSPNSPFLYSPQKINTSSRNKYGETLLHSACKKGNISRVTAILASPNVMVNAKDNLGWTPMHEATSKGHLECVKKLLNYKPATIKSFFTPSKKGSASNTNPNDGEANINKVNLWALGGPDKITPLADGIKNGHVDVVEIILQFILSDQSKQSLWELKKMIEFKTKSGKDCNDIAAETGNEVMINLLKQKSQLIEQALIRETGENFPPASFIKSKGLVLNINSHISKSETSLVEDPSSSVTDLLRYKTLCCIYLYKYITCFKLPFTGNHMQNIAQTRASSSSSILESPKHKNNEIDEKPINIYSTAKLELFEIKCNIPDSKLITFAYARSSETLATDVRTYLKLCRKGSVKPIDVLLKEI